MRTSFSNHLVYIYIYIYHIFAEGVRYAPPIFQLFSVYTYIYTIRNDVKLAQLVRAQDC